MSKIEIDLSKLNDNSAEKHNLAIVKTIFEYLQHCNTHPELTDGTCFVCLMKNKQDNKGGSTFCEVCGDLELATALSVDAIRNFVNSFGCNNFQKAEVFNIIAEMFSSYAKECKEQNK